MKKILILVVILIIIIVIFLWINQKIQKKNSTDYNLNTEFEKQEHYQTSTKIEKVKIRNKYYAVKDIMDRYLENINHLQEEESSQEAIQSIYGMLAQEYVDEFNLNQNLIKEKYSKYADQEQVEIQNMYLAEKTATINIYFIEGKTLVDQSDFNLMIKTDSKNSTFSIYPEEYMKKYNYSINSTLEQIKIGEQEIIKNEFNQFKYKNIKDETVAVEYFNQFKKMLYVNSQNAYDLLDSEYRDKRFQTQTKFNDYLKKNQSDLSKIEIESYLVNNEDGYKQYVCKDQYGNVYIFEEKAIMDYTVMLDTYTIETDKFRDTYNRAEKNQQKVMMNIDKWIMMLNRRDYEAAYEVLDETFKKNYFGSEQNFEQFMRENYAYHYKVTYSNYEEETDLGIQTISLMDVTEKESKELKIIMKLKDNTDFVMSFNV